METHKFFSKYVIDTFLTDDRKGEFASLVIDDQFVESAASELNITLDEFLKCLRSELFYQNHNKTSDIDFAIAIISLQLYAASKCETDCEYSANAYNPRLCEIVNCEAGYLQSWYRNNQKSIWGTFYKWCRENSFLVKECLPRDFRNKYIQYPLELAKYLLNREDFKYIASKFNKYKLRPYENVFYSDFWKIINIQLDFKNLNNHVTKVIDAVYEHTSCYDIVQTQIYNYFLKWDGEYFDLEGKNASKVKSKEPFKLHLSNKEGIYRIDIRKDDGSKVSSIKMDVASILELKNYYSFKREGVIIFQRCDSGDLDYWDETRFIESKEYTGLAVVFKNFQQSNFDDARILFYTRNLIVYEFSYSQSMDEFYSDGEKAFALFGGLKIANNTYMVGGEPILRIYSDCVFLIDGNSHPATKGEYILDLPTGVHILKFPKSREIKISIITPFKETVEWTDKQSKWEINKRDVKWGPSLVGIGVVGLNFGHYSKKDKSQSTLQSWGRLNQGKKISSESNISLKLLNNNNQYE